jgi:hypothetical protein
MFVSRSPFVVVGPLLSALSKAHLSLGLGGFRLLPSILLTLFVATTTGWNTSSLPLTNKVKLAFVELEIASFIYIIV